MTEHWLSRVAYLHKVTGEEIVEEQHRINSGDNMFVKATTIHPVIVDGSTTGRFYVWIYYNVHPQALVEFDENGKVRQKEIKL